MRLRYTLGLAGTVLLREPTTPRQALEEAGYPVDLDSVTARKDVAAIISGFRLQKVRRFFHQKHWHRETVQAVLADTVESRLKLESVAAHSWHVADCALLLAPQFPDLDLTKVTTAAILHDKLEMITGDFDPVGPDGQGTQTHAFQEKAADMKLKAELHALEEYLAQLNSSAAAFQRAAFNDIIYNRTEEARFIKAVDKLQALAFVLVKKGGDLSDPHLRFTVRYSSNAVKHYRALSPQYSVLLSLLSDSVHAYRKADRTHLIVSTLREALRG